MTIVKYLDKFKVNLIGYLFSKNVSLTFSRQRGLRKKFRKMEEQKKML